jgi:2-(1,2-epoxy-1,2-dihydrophenyl)acetyl-CoA isomerase
MTDCVTTTIAASIAVVEMHRPPANFFDEALLTELADVVTGLDEDDQVRCIILCSEGKHFCAGADLREMTAAGLRRVYAQALRLFSGRRPTVAAVQGSAVGGGLGLALAADFRTGAPPSRFTANFARLGFHHGFGLSVTLPAAVGQQRAQEMLYTGRVVHGSEALSIGLCDRLSETDPREAAWELATEIAQAAPLSVRAIRETMRGRLAAEVGAALDTEAAAQGMLLSTADFREGIEAARSRRDPKFSGR